MDLAVFPRFVGVNVVLIRMSFPPLSVFDDEDENKLSYTDIHMQYKKLVSAIFYSFFFGPVSSAYCKVSYFRTALHQHYSSVGFGLHTHRPGLM